jgi:hypothetical protein
MVLLRKRLGQRRASESLPPKMFGQANAEPPPDPWFNPYRIPATEHAYFAQPWPMFRRRWRQSDP